MREILFAVGEDNGVYVGVEKGSSDSKGLTIGSDAVLDLGADKIGYLGVLLLSKSKRNRPSSAKIWSCRHE